MIRRLVNPSLLLTAVSTAAAAVVISPATVAASSPRALFSGTATGTVTAASDSSFTIQTAGPRVGVVNALTAAATAVTNRDYPYVYGGGHAQAGIASIGVRSRGRRIGFDCSGSVAAVLAAAGLWTPGTGVPNDAGVISALLQDGLIARGVGRGPVQVTLYDHPGVHIFMNIDGRFFGTSDGAGGGNPRGGAGWLDDGAPDASTRAYKRYHLLPTVLRRATTYGHIVSFQLGSLQSPLPAVELGEKVRVSYEEARSGALVTTGLMFPDANTTSGSVTTIAPDGSSFTIQDPSGTTLVFSTADNPALSQALNVGDVVQVSYLGSNDTATALTVTVVTPAPSNPGGDASSTSPAP